MFEQQPAVEIMSAAELAMCGDPALEMLFSNINQGVIYRNKQYVPLPKADVTGKIGSHILIMLTPNQTSTFQELESGYIRWWLAGYKWYSSDAIFKGKIGRKRIYINQTIQSKRRFESTQFGHPLRYLTVQQRKARLKETPNLILDLGEWMRLYFQYIHRCSPPVCVKKFMEFFREKMTDPTYGEYQHRILYIPLNLWFTEKHQTLSFGYTGMTNPMAIMLFAAYRYSELFQGFPNDVKVIFGDAANDQFLMYDLKNFDRKGFQQMKMRLRTMKAFKWNEESEGALTKEYAPEELDEDSDLNNGGMGRTYADARGLTGDIPDNATVADVQKLGLARKNRDRLINEVKKAMIEADKRESTDIPTASPEEAELEETDPLDREIASRSVQKKTLPISTTQITSGEEPATTTMPVAALSGKKVKVNATPVVVEGKVIGNTVATTRDTNDITEDPEVYDDEDTATVREDPITLDDGGELDEIVENAVDDVIEDMQRTNPDVLLNANGDLDATVVAAAVEKQIKKSFTPKLNEEQEAQRKELQAAQAKVIVKKTSAQQAKSKIIKTTNLDKAVQTNNSALKTAKFPNFDKCYNEQKLQDDIDNAVAALSKASSPVYIVSKVEEDTSDALNLKKTITYTLRDVYGGTHVIKVDVPIIIDNNYIYMNGSKIQLGHQMMMMPIVKVSPTDVQIVTWYAKMTVRRMGSRDARTDAIKRYLINNSELFDITPGNAINHNTANGYQSTIDIDVYAKNIIAFTMGSVQFILDRHTMLEFLVKVAPMAKIRRDAIPVGYDRDTKEVIYVTSTEDLTYHIMSRLTEAERVKISKMTVTRKQKILHAAVKVSDRFIPLVLLLLFYEGFATVMKKADVLYHVIDKSEGLPSYERQEYEMLELQDVYILWARNPIWNTMLMNGFSGVDMSVFTYAELEERETYANLLSQYFGTKNSAITLLQFYDFMLDPATLEILQDFDLPQDLVSLLLLACRMLADNNFTPINSAKAIRIRSNEIIAQMIYKEVTNAYRAFRATEYKAGTGRRKPDRITINPQAPVKKLMTSALTNDASDLNPLLTLEKNRAITPKGPSGVNKDRALTLPRRAYDPSMVGIAGITTPPDAKTGVVRQLTLEPNITSVRGYVQTIDSDEDLDAASNANLMTPAELLSPPGALHDDAPRTAMAYKQSQYMVPVKGACPVFFGNKVESVIPYHLDSEFTIVAQDDGEVISIENGIVIVRYKNGQCIAIDTNPKMKKNSSGFFVQMQLKCDLKVGEKVKKNQVLAYNPVAFTKNSNDLSASMNIGVPTKVAILPNFDIYEDAAPITSKMGEKFTTYMSMREGVGIPAHSYVESYAKIGDVVDIGDPLIVYDPAHEDESVDDFIASIRDKLGENLSDIIDVASMQQLRTENAGTIVAVEAYTSVPIEELSDSLREMFLHFTEHGVKVNDTLNKYQNDSDMNYYKCGQLIKNSRDIVRPDYGNRVKGYVIGDDGRGVAIIYYVEFKDIAKAGDKGSAYTALKFTTSHVIAEGRESYSEYRPEEDISTYIAPGSVLARKTPSIWETMAMNKCLIEMTRHAIDIFFNDAPEKHYTPLDELK